jgi:ferritin-like metal-binding protein YciE
MLDYLAQAEHHCEQLELISHQAQESLAGERCRVMEGFLKQALEFAETRGDERVLDLALISVMRQTCHYEKSSYEIARSLADVLDEPDALKLLERMLSEAEQMERSFLILSEDMMDSALHEQRSHLEEPRAIAPQGNA